MLAAQAVRAGDAELVLAGGMESMSRAPFLLFGARSGWKIGDHKAEDALIHDGLWCAIEDLDPSLLELTVKRIDLDRVEPMRLDQVRHLGERNRAHALGLLDQLL